MFSPPSRITSDLSPLSNQLPVKRTQHSHSPLPRQAVPPFPQQIHLASTQTPLRRRKFRLEISRFSKRSLPSVRALLGIILSAASCSRLLPEVQDGEAELAMVVVEVTAIFKMYRKAESFDVYLSSFHN
ncbi:Uncharacterized protein Rs2_07560 [Raphanus sativus]|nr:Uncharacterized protein Rs2_07560 [Raphanus sativus]